MKLQQGQSRGITLIELILYIAILTFMLIILTNFFGGVLRTKGVTDAKVEVVGNLRFIAERITQEVRRASSASVSACSGGLNTLTLGTNSFSVSAGALQFNGNSLSSAQISVIDPGDGGCLFEVIPNSGSAKPTVRVNLKIKYNDLGRPGLRYAETIKTSASLR